MPDGIRARGRGGPLLAFVTLLLLVPGTGASLGGGPSLPALRAGPSVGPLTVNVSQVTSVSPNGCGTLPIVVTLRATVAGGAPPYLYAWSFGDGNHSTGGPEVTHAYAGWGSYNATATVTDSTDLSASSTLMLWLFPPPCPSRESPVRSLLAEDLGGAAAPVVLVLSFGAVVVGLAVALWAIRRPPPRYRTRG